MVSATKNFKPEERVLFYFTLNQNHKIGNCEKLRNYSLGYYQVNLDSWVVTTETHTRRNDDYDTK